MKIQGRDYAPVADRIRAMRQDHAPDDWRILTEVLQHDVGQFVMVKAMIVDQHGQPLATAHAIASVETLSRNVAPRYVEKAETSAIGRALSFLGYGTQDLYSDEDDDYIADAPVNNNKRIGAEMADSIRALAVRIFGKEASAKESGWCQHYAVTNLEQLVMPQADALMSRLRLMLDEGGVAK